MIGIWEKFIRRVKAGLSWYFRRYTLKNLEDLPEERNIRNYFIYWVGERHYKWCLVFRCPCGCREVIYLNLLTTSRPSWQLINNNKRTCSITPSINRVKGCRSHFFVKEGRIIWAN